MKNLNKQAFLSIVISSFICLILLGPVPGKVTVQEVFAQPLGGDTIYVDKNAHGNGSGTSWNNAFTTIQGAIDSVNPGTEVNIFVAQGVYPEHNLILQGGIKLYGSFEGYETSLAERGDVWTNNHWTVIDAERLHRVLTMGDKSEVNGFILRNGLRDYTLQSNTTLDDSRGGGIYITCDDDVVVRNNIIEDCAVYWQGGGIFIEGSCNNTPAAPLIEFNVIRSCTGYCGGGIEIAGVPEYAPGGTDAIIRHNVLRNNADGGTSELGFGLELWTEYEDQCSPRMGDFYNNIIIGFANQRGSIWSEDVHVWARNTTDRSFISTSWSLGDFLYEGCYRYGNPDNYNIFGSDPMFVDEANSNYHLRIGSPCIGTGRGGVDIGLFPYNGDSQPPVISNVASSGITSSGATITWSTNESSDSQVQYGLTTSYGSSTTLNTNLVTNHSVVLSGLSASTTVHYRVKSKDAAANAAVSGDYSFTTTATLPDTQPPMISGVASSGITSSAATITWSTNETSDSQAEYGLTTSYGSSTPLNTSMVTSHSIILSGLSASTTYHYRVTSGDTAGNLATSGDYSFTTSAQPPAGWDGYGYRRAIAIDYTKVTPCSSNLSNFPVLVSLSGTWLKTTANGGSIYNSSGYDIIFKASDGSTKLDHEIEKYDGMAGTLVAWVRVPTLSYTANTTIYIYYGNSEISTDQSNPTGVWDSNFVAVWHLKEDPSGGAPQMKNSVSTVNHCTSGGGMAAGDQIVGKLDGSLNFDGTYDYLDCGNNSSMQLTGAMTASVWVNVDSIPSQSGRFVTKNGASGSRGWDLNLEASPDGKAYFRVASNSSTMVGTPTTVTVPTGQWVHYVGVYVPSTAVRIYVNGQLNNSNTTSIPASQYNSPNNVLIGARTTCTNCYLDGKLDEIRISNSARSSCWVGTEYSNQNSPSTFSTLGSEELPSAEDTDPPVISSVTSSGRTASGATITWTTNEASDSQVEYGLTTSYGSSGPFNNSPVTNHSVVLSGLNASTTYHYRVKSTDPAANWAVSGDYTFTTAAPPDTQTPTVPAGLAATAISSTQISLSWAASTDNMGVTGYRIYRDGSQITTTAGTSYQDTGRTPSTTYTYTVAAYDAAGNASAQSSQASATTPALLDTQKPTVPKGLKATVISSTQINLSWTASTDNVGVTGYKIYQNNIQIGTTANTSYQSTGLKANTSYSYRVAAYDQTGNTSAKSVSVSAKTQPSPSTMFTIGDRVQTISNASVRSAPSSSGTASGTQLKGAMGRVAGGPWYWNVQWWWQIDFDSGADGWVAQGKLKKVVP